MTAVRRALGDVDAPANAENNHDADKDGECDVERTSVRGKVSPPLSICSVSTSIAPKEVKKRLLLVGEGVKARADVIATYSTGTEQGEKGEVACQGQAIGGAARQTSQYERHQGVRWLGRVLRMRLLYCCYNLLLLIHILSLESVN